MRPGRCVTSWIDTGVSTTTSSCRLTSHGTTTTTTTTTTTRTRTRTTTTTTAFGWRGGGAGPNRGADCCQIDQTPAWLLFFQPERETLYILSLDWQRNLISDGLFTVESDRAVVVKLGEMALQSKKQHLNELGPLTDYRFHLAQQPRLLNQTKKGLELQSFLQHFNFPNIDAAVKHESGMAGMLCAILEGDVNIVQALVEHHGDVNVRVSGIRHLGYSDGLTLLMVASYGVPDSKMLFVLINLHADPSLSCISETGSIITASWHPILDMWRSCWKRKLTLRHHQS